MKETAVASSAVLLALWMFASCGPHQPTGNCAVDCSNWSTGRTDMKNYTYMTREDCVQKAKSSGCPTQWCNYDCEGSCCESVH